MIAVAGAGLRQGSNLGELGPVSTVSDGAKARRGGSRAWEAGSPPPGSMDDAESYVERLPLPALAGRVRTVWVERSGPRPQVQRNLPTGGVEVQCRV